MFVVRPVEMRDIAALEVLASEAKPGVHTFPRGRAAIEAAVENSLASFASEPELPGGEAYMFVLESLADGALSGSAMVSALAGSNGIFFAFRNDVIQQVSRDLNIRHSVHVLTLCSDLTGHSQLSAFYVRNGRRAGAEAALLSRARLLYAAAHPARFSDRFFSSLAGMTDRHGESPFWDALGRKFFQMNFLDAERAIAGARNRTLIVELMPHYPVYVPLLSSEARDAMGLVHSEGEMPLRLLSQEGFEPDAFIDIFDGGPILQAHKMALRSFSASQPRRVAEADSESVARHRVAYLVSTLEQQHFRAVMVWCDELEIGAMVPLPPQARKALNVGQGDKVLTVQL